jgi:hypothetical protein
MTKAIAVQCKAISKQTGKQCKRKAIPGGEVCRYHGGSARQVKVKAAIRAEVMNWGLGDSIVDPGEVLLRLSPSPPLELSDTPPSSSNWSTMRAWPQQWSARSRYRPSTAATRPASTSEVSLSSKHRNVIAARTSPPKPLLLVLPNAPYGWPNGKSQLMVEMVQAALREVDLSPEQASAFKAASARQARELSAPS